MCRRCIDDPVDSSRVLLAQIRNDMQNDTGDQRHHIVGLLHHAGQSIEKVHEEAIREAFLKEARSLWQALDTASNVQKGVLATWCTGIAETWHRVCCWLATCSSRHQRLPEEEPV